MTIDEGKQRLLRWGVCGCGNIASDFVNAMSACPGSTVTAVATSSDLGRARSFATDHINQDGSVPAAHGSYAELLARDDVDVVYVSTINITHRSIAEEALRAGKHVLCEKPLAMKESDVNAIVNTAKTTGKFLMEGMWTRFYPAMVELRRIIESGEIGTVVHAAGDFGFKGRPEQKRAWTPSLGGGSLFDIGIYPLYFALDCFGGATPTEIVATGGLRTGVDEWISIVLKYDDASDGTTGRFATVMSTFSAQTPEEWTVVGTKGRVRVHTQAHTPTRMTISINQGRGKTADREWTCPLPILPQTKVPMFYPNGEGFVYEIKAVEKKLAETEPGVEHGLVSHRDSVLVAHIIEQARTQAGCEMAP